MYLDPRNTYYRTPALNGAGVQPQQIPWVAIGIGALVGYVVTRRGVGALGGAVGTALVMGGRKP